jgi:hypothetical protein
VKNFELKFALKFSGILKFEHFYIKFMERKVAAFKELLDIMDQLRDKCPWDREQTLESLRKLTIEETYELADAILQNDLNGIKKELRRPDAAHRFLCQNWFRKRSISIWEMFWKESIKN